MKDYYAINEDDIIEIDAVRSQCDQCGWKASSDASTFCPKCQINLTQYQITTELDQTAELCRIAADVLSDAVKCTRYSLLGCWELCSTEPKEALYQLGTRVQIQFTDDGRHIYCSAGLTPLGMQWSILPYKFMIVGNELVLKPEKESDYPYAFYSNDIEIIYSTMSEMQRIDHFQFSIRPGGSLIIYGEVQCVYERVAKLAFSLPKKRAT